LEINTSIQYWEKSLHILLLNCVFYEQGDPTIDGMTQRSDLTIEESKETEATETV